ncbi:hypothetical protein [Desulfosudis oleivorans]|nr:hypothetical protein [Desulfosudis oleivorans]
MSIKKQRYSNFFGVSQNFVFLKIGENTRFGMIFKETQKSGALKAVG